jgi:hypothetical protein
MYCASHTWRALDLAPAIPHVHAQPSKQMPKFRPLTATVARLQFEIATQPAQRPSENYTPQFGQYAKIHET